MVDYGYISGDTDRITKQKFFLAVQKDVLNFESARKYNFPKFTLKCLRDMKWGKIANFISQRHFKVKFEILHFYPLSKFKTSFCWAKKNFWIIQNASSKKLQIIIRQKIDNFPTFHIAEALWGEIWDSSFLPPLKI